MFLTTTTQRLVAVLRELGADDESMAFTMAMYLNADGVLHQEDRCSRPTREHVERTSVNVDVIAHVDELCPACAWDAHTSDSRLRRMEPYIEIFDYAQRRDVPDDPYETLRLLRACNRGFDWLRADTSPVRDAARELLSARYRQLKATLRDPETIEKIRSSVRAERDVAADDTEVIVGLYRYNPARNPFVVTDIIVAAFWRHHIQGGNFVLVTTADMVASLDGHLVSGAHMAPPVAVCPGETDSLAETIAGLWLPGTDESLSDFTAAVDAARRLLD